MKWSIRKFINYTTKANAVDELENKVRYAVNNGKYSVSVNWDDFYFNCDAYGIDEAEIEISENTAEKLIEKFVVYTQIMALINAENDNSLRASDVAMFYCITKDEATEE